MNTLDAAVKYLSAGWSVIPLKPSGKTPFIEWKEYQSRKPTLDEVTAWFSGTKNNIGVVTGAVSGLVVRDIDVGRGGDPSKVAREFPTGFSVATGGGGVHLYYSHPGKPVGNGVGADGVDIRGDGGYVVAPPSVHASGKQYAWISSSGAPAPYLFPRTAGKKSSVRRGWVSDLLTSQMGDGQGRNNATAKLAGYLVSRGVPEDICSELLKLWNAAHTPPLPESELRATVASIYKGSAPSTGFDIVPFSEYLAKYGCTTVSWLADEWLPEATIAFCIAPPGSYKTWLLCDLAVSCASGTPFLGKYACKKTSVLFIQQEDWHAQTALRIASIVQSRGLSGVRPGSEFALDVPSLPINFHTDRSLAFGDPASVAQFVDAVHSLRPGLVVIDPLYTAVSTDDYMSKAAEQMQVLKRLRDSLGCTFVIAHHTSKSGADSTSRSRLWGSQFLNAFLESGWQVSKTSDTSVVVLRHFKLAPATSGVKITFSISTSGAYSAMVEPVSPVAVAAEDAVLNSVRGAARTPAEISTLCGKNRGTVYKLLVKLLAGQRVIQQGDRYIAREESHDTGSLPF